MIMGMVVMVMVVMVMTIATFLACLTSSKGNAQGDDSRLPIRLQGRSPGRISDNRLNGLSSIHTTRGMPGFVTRPVTWQRLHDRTVWKASGTRINAIRLNKTVSRLNHPLPSMPPIPCETGKKTAACEKQAADEFFKAGATQPVQLASRIPMSPPSMEPSLFRSYSAC